MRYYIVWSAASSNQWQTGSCYMTVDGDLTQDAMMQISAMIKDAAPGIPAGVSPIITNMIPLPGGIES